jgi:hypothetical protein
MRLAVKTTTVPHTEEATVESDYSGIFDAGQSRILSRSVMN